MSDQQTSVFNLVVRHRRDTCWAGGIILTISKYSPRSGAAACRLQSSTILGSLNLATTLFPSQTAADLTFPAQCIVSRRGTCTRLVKQSTAPDTAINTLD